MTHEEFEKKYAEYLKIVEDRLEPRAKEVLPTSSEVGNAARYSLLSGGKRIRAILVLATCEMMGGDYHAAADLAVAVEMLHCYSLIHDDLPCMDNDDYRRGKPSCHKVYGEATALLAGDALQAAAFEVITYAPLSILSRLGAVRELAMGSGDRGMVLGQELDLYYESRNATASELRKTHMRKTGSLIHAAMQMGAWAAEARPVDRYELENYAFNIGLAFQIVDDVLDATSTTEELGKPVGSDSGNGKTTYITLYGAEEAMKRASDLTRGACRDMQNYFGDKADFLVELANSLLMRRK